MIMDEIYETHKEMDHRDRYNCVNFQLHAADEEDMSELEEIMQRFVKAHNVHAKVTRGRDLPVNVFLRPKDSPEVRSVWIGGKNLSRIMQIVDPNEKNPFSKIGNAHDLEKGIVSTDSLTLSESYPGGAVYNFGKTKISIDYRSNVHPYAKIVKNNSEST